MTIYDAWCQQWRVINVNGLVCRFCVPCTISGARYLISLGGWKKRSGFCVPAKLNEECKVMKK